ncbi:MAG: alpha/beta hydrolase [Dehalococcoidia bacterium]
MRDITLTERTAAAQPTEHRFDVDGLGIAYFEWAAEGNPDAAGRPVLLAHATGFHARTWDAVSRLLPGHRVVAIDMRGHGRSDNPEPPIAWDPFGEDVAALARHIDLRDAIGVGHSMGGHSTTIAAALEPSRFAALLLLDPVMHGARPADAPANEGAGPDTTPREAFHFVAKRRNQWAGPQEMVERFQDRFPYSAWAPGVLDDYARYGLAPAPDGEGYALACPPALEAAIYAAGGSGPDVAVEVVPKVRVPVRVVRARQRVPGEESAPFATSPTRPDLASLFADGEDLLMPAMSHFIPMEDPALVARQVRDLDARLDAAR